MEPVTGETETCIGFFFGENLNLVTVFWVSAFDKQAKSVLPIIRSKSRVITNIS